MFRAVIDAFLLLSRRQKWWFLLLVGVRSVLQILDLFGLLAVGLIAAVMSTGPDGIGPIQRFGVVIPVSGPRDVIFMAVATVFFFVFKSAVSSILLRVTTLFLASVETESANRVAQQIFGGGLKEIREQSESEHLWSVSVSSHAAFSSMLFSAASLVSESTLFLTILVLFGWVDPLSTVLVAGYFVVVVSLFHFSISRKLKRLGTRITESSVGVQDAVGDLVRAFREISVLEKSDYFLEKFSKARKIYAADYSLQRFVVGFPRFLVETALMLGFLALILWQYSQGNLAQSLPTTAVFLVGGLRMMAALLPIQNAVSDIKINGPQALRAQEFLRKARGQLPKAAVPQAEERNWDIGSSPYGVELEGVSFRYAAAPALAIDEATMHIKPGAFCAFVGPSGAGKSTLADIILGLQDPHKGTVKINGVNPRALRKAAPGTISYVPQRPGLVAGTIAQNVALGVSPQDVDRDRVQEVLALAGLGTVVRGLPSGIDTNLGKHYEALSGGQVQRLGLARAMYTKPLLLVLDEATSALDAETEAEVSAAIQRLRRETTVVVIAHRISTIQDADEIYFIGDGKIVANGTFEELRKSVPALERYVSLMQVRERA